MLCNTFIDNYNTFSVFIYKILNAMAYCPLYNVHCRGLYSSLQLDIPPRPYF